MFNVQDFYAWSIRRFYKKKKIILYDVFHDNEFLFRFTEYIDPVTGEIKTRPKRKDGKDGKDGKDEEPKYQYVSSRFSAAFCSRFVWFKIE